jgi:hypothetical protein
MKRNNVVKNAQVIQARSSTQGQSCCSKEEQIRKKAYELFEKRGCQPGYELEDWIEAERLVSK